MLSTCSGHTMYALSLSSADDEGFSQFDSAARRISRPILLKAKKSNSGLKQKSNHES
jgi:hypothetical protein